MRETVTKKNALIFGLLFAAMCQDKGHNKDGEDHTFLHARTGLLEVQIMQRN